MLDLGTVRPGTTLYIPFNTFDSNDPAASVTITGLATTDIEVYKDGSTTQRASDSGYALLDTDGIDFDSTTGIHGISIDLSDNTTAGFYAAGSQYWVVIASITVDAATINFLAATFRIGYPDAILNTTIATLASQTSFTLTAGPGDDNALNGMPVIVHDVASAVQIAKGIISAYTGSTKTVTLDADPGIFTMAAGDNISVFIGAALNPTARANIETAGDNYSATRGLTGTAVPAAAADGAGGLPISDAGGQDLDTAIANIAAALVDTNELQADWTNGGRLDLLIDAIKAVTDAIPDSGALTTLIANVAAILVDTGTTLPATLGTPAGASLAADVAAVQADTDDIQTRIPAALVGGRIDATVDATGMEAGAVDQILDEQLTDSIPAVGTLPTMRQLLYIVGQYFQERAVSGTTLTVYKADGTTPLMTFTLNDASNPTALTRAT